MCFLLFVLKIVLVLRSWEVNTAGFSFASVFYSSGFQPELLGNILQISRSRAEKRKSLESLVVARGVEESHCGSLILAFFIWGVCTIAADSVWRPGWVDWGELFSNCRWGRVSSPFLSVFFFSYFNVILIDWTFRNFSNFFLANFLKMFHLRDFLSSCR